MQVERQRVDEGLPCVGAKGLGAALPLERLRACFRRQLGSSTSPCTSAFSSSRMIRPYVGLDFFRPLFAEHRGQQMVKAIVILGYFLILEREGQHRLATQLELRGGGDPALGWFLDRYVVGFGGRLGLWGDPAPGREPAESKSWAAPRKSSAAERRPVPPDTPSDPPPSSEPRRRNRRTCCSAESCRRETALRTGERSVWRDQLGRALKAATILTCSGLQPPGDHDGNVIELRRALRRSRTPRCGPPRQFRRRADREGSTPESASRSSPKS